MWKPIAELPKYIEKNMFIAIAVHLDFVSNPYCVWVDKSLTTGYARWPHEFKPTHFMLMDEAPQYVISSKTKPFQIEDNSLKLKRMVNHLIVKPLDK